jgi:hypothetical protein
MTAKKVKLIPAVARLDTAPNKRRAQRTRQQRQITAWRKQQSGKETQRDNHNHINPQED